MHSLLRKTHITAASFCGSYVLLGEGNELSAYSIESLDEVGRYTTFPSCRVHGIRPAELNHSKAQCAIFGSKYITIVQIEVSCSGKLEFHSEFLSPVHLGDWIWDVRWMCGGELSVCLGHNRVLLWHPARTEILYDEQGSDRCILYCASLIGSTWDTLVAAVGTVFQEVVLWAPSEASVLHRLTGHQGVIFSVAYNVNLRLLCSTSDDRSMRVYKFLGPETTAGSDLSLAEWRRGSFNCIHTLFGHSSRVWRAACLDSCHVSVGEDSYFCVWSKTGSLLYRMASPGEGSIWCLAVNEEQSLALTGSSGSALCLWHLPDVTSHAAQTTLLRDYQETQDFPKNLTLLRADDRVLLLIATSEGGLYSKKLDESEYVEVVHRGQSLSYSVFSVSPCEKYVAVGTMDGNILILSVEGGTVLNVCAETVIHTGKVHSIEWIARDPHTILSCGPNGAMVMSRLRRTNSTYELVICTNCVLPMSKQRWVTSAVYLPSTELLVAGDRGGSINVFRCHQVSGTWHQPQEKGRFPGVHGRDGVTHVLATSAGVLSSGRDGRILLFTASSEDGLQLLRTFWWSVELEWIGRLYLYKDDLLIAGYHTTDFVLWSTKQDRAVMKVSCGGGHRPWHFILGSCGEAVFTCLKKRDILVHRCDLSNALDKSCLKAAVHKKKICAACILYVEEEKGGGTNSFIAMAGEGNVITISLLHLDGKQCNVQTLCQLYGHISSVRAMAWTKISGRSSSSVLLASAGGKAQLILWSVSASKQCQAGTRELANHLLWSADKQRKKHQGSAEDPLARYMDVAIWEIAYCHFCIATAGSDTFLRIFKYTAGSSSLEIIKSIAAGEHCLLRCLKTTLNGGCSLLLTAGNDGVLRFFALSNTLECHFLDSLKVHQSGINALDALASKQGDELLVLSGGDDTRLAITSIAVRKDKVTKFREYVVESAHCAQITGVKIMNPHWMLSTGVDQRLHLWTVEDEALKLSCSRLSCIPDISCCAFWRTDTCPLSLVCGEGLELCSMPNRCIVEA
uniref:tRNA (34-2'-O)-methyltransferase regulator WDR6 n=1 Tax=Ornithodoros turicata TaxID=34597 RepID=A0A2R5LAT4_9ACAR